MTAAASLGRPRIRRPPLGLSTKIYLALAGAVACTLVASVVAWISFVELGHLQRQITREHIPSIADSLRLARQSALIAATVPALISAADDADRQRVISALHAQERALGELMGALARDMAGDTSAVADEDRVSAVREKSQLLSGTLDQLDAAVRLKIELTSELGRATREAAEHHRVLLALLAPLLDDATLYLATGYRTLDDAEPDPPAKRFTKEALVTYAAM